MLLAELLHLCPMLRRMVVLIDLVGGEVADVDIGGETGFERCADIAQLFEDDALEKGVASDLGAAVGPECCSQTLGRVAEEAIERSE